MFESKKASEVLTWFSLGAVLIIVLAVPLGYFYLSYEYMSGNIQGEMRINARLITDIINANPELWELEQIRLRSALEHQQGKEYQETRRILNLEGEVVAESVGKLDSPVIERESALMDSGTPVGKIVVVRSLRSLLVKTILLAALSVATGIAVFVLIVVVPVRAMAHKEEALLQSENKFRTLFDSATDAILILDMDGNFMDINRTAYERLGYTKEEMSSMDLRRLEHPDFRDGIPERLRHLQKHGWCICESAHLRKDGTVVPVEINARIVDFEGKKVIFSIMRDITSRKKADDAIRESEKRYRALFDQSPDGIVLINTEGKLVEFNETAHRELGYTREEFSQLSVSDLDPFEGPDEVKARMRKILQEGKADFYVKHRTKQGELRDVHVITQIIELSGKPFSHAIWHDVTEIKNIRDRLEEKTAEQDAILENALAGIALLKDRRIVWINTKMEEMFGCRLGEVMGLTTEAFYVSSESYEQLGKEAYPLLVSGRTYSSERLMKRKDGAVFWCSLSGKAVDPAVADRGSIWILQDITEHRRMEEDLRSSRDLVENIIDTVDEAFIVVDRDYRIVMANTAYGKQANMTVQETVGRHCYEVSHKSDRPCYESGEECSVRLCFEKGEPHTCIHKHPHKDGMLYVETKAFPLRDASGKVISVIEVINNITDKHLLEEQLLRNQKLEAVGLLAGGIAHDFNNLLQGIFGYISMARTALDQKERALAMLDQSERALHMAVNLTTQLLTFSKGGKPVKKKIQLQPVIENSVRFALSGSRADYRVSLNRGLWAVEADEGQIGQAIQNIVLNAVQAMPLGGTVLVAAENIHTPEKRLPAILPEGNYVEISIRDNGIGIPEHFLSRIFDPYFTTKEKGSGLGLATSYSIIKGHGGTIHVQSDLGKGSKFFVYLPAIEAGEPKAETIPAKDAVVRKGRILVMDDEDLVRNIVGEMITSLGHDVKFAANGEEAIARYLEAISVGVHFDVVILDLTIRGGMGGEETMGRLLEIDPDVKGILSSGYADSSATSGYEALGFGACLTKPYQIDELKEALNAMLG